MGTETRVELAGPAFAGLGRLRKIALLGCAASVAEAPWEDQTWELWAHTSAKRLCRRVDRYFDLHRPAVWLQPKPWDPQYPAWLARQTTPIFMQDHYAQVPASLRYPKARILAEFRPFVSTQVGWMIALALTEGVTHLGLFGIHFAPNSVNPHDYTHQRGSALYWLGVAEGRGAHLVVPEACPIFRDPPGLYGYDYP